MEGSGSGSISGSSREITDPDPRFPKTNGSRTLLYTIPGTGCTGTWVLYSDPLFNNVCGFGSHSIWNTDPDLERQYFKKILLTDIIRGF
jgi:hypothetical protein